MLAVARSLATIVLAGLFTTVNGYVNKFFIVNGPSYIAVGERMFASYERSHSCMRVTVKRYPDEHVIIHACEV